MKETWLNQSIIEQMETEDLWAWRSNLERQLGNTATFISQIDWVLQQRGEK